MIKIKIIKDKLNVKVESIGHANYAEYGKDIICSAVSILIINTINSIEKFTISEIKIHSADEGNLKFEILNIDNNSELLLKTMVFGLENIKNEYGKQYIDVIYTEV